LRPAKQKKIVLLDSPKQRLYSGRSRDRTDPKMLKSQRGMRRREKPTDEGRALVATEKGEGKEDCQLNAGERLTQRKKGVPSNPPQSKREYMQGTGAIFHW